MATDASEDAVFHQIPFPQALQSQALMEPMSSSPSSS
jgi:hypothetical protein